MGVGLLGIVLLAVGAVLLRYGVTPFFKNKDGTALEGKHYAFVDFAGGIIIGLAGIYYAWEGAYFAAAVTILVSVTYIWLGFLARNPEANQKPFGAFCLLVSFVLGLGVILDAIGIRDGGGWRSVFSMTYYINWTILWFALAIECMFDKQDKLGKPIAFLCLFQAVWTGLVPGLLMVGGVW